MTDQQTIQKNSAKTRVFKCLNPQDQLITANFWSVVAGDLQRHTCSHMTMAQTTWIDPFKEITQGHTTSWWDLRVHQGVKRLEIGEPTPKLTWEPWCVAFSGMDFFAVFPTFRNRRNFLIKRLVSQPARQVETLLVGGKKNWTSLGPLKHQQGELRFFYQTKMSLTPFWSSQKNESHLENHHPPKAPKFFVNLLKSSEANNPPPPLSLLAWDEMLDGSSTFQWGGL